MMRKANSKGFSLIEMMIALTISVAFVGAAATLMVRNKTDYVPLRDMARMNEKAMAAIGTMRREIEQAGFYGENDAFGSQGRGATGGVSNRFVNHSFNVTQPTTRLVGITRNNSAAIEGYDDNMPGAGFYPSGTLTFNDTTTFLNDPDLGVLSGTDAITIRGSLGSSVQLLAVNPAVPGAVGQRGPGVTLSAQAPAGSTTIAVTSAANLPSNGYFVIFDGMNSEIFYGTVSGNVITMTVPDPFSGVMPTGLTNSFVTLVPVPAAAVPPAPNGQAYVTLAKFSRYYIRNFTPPGSTEVIPTLFREYYDPGTNAVQQQVLIEGVENMQITYGVNNGSGTSVNNAYLRADQVTDWQAVSAVRLALLVRSETQSSIDPTVGSQTYNVNGVNVVPGTSDRFVRKVYTAHINLDNTL